MILNALKKLFFRLRKYNQYETTQGNFVSYFESILNNQINNIILFDKEFKILAFNRKIESDIQRIKNIQLKINDSVLFLIAENNLNQFKKDVSDTLKGKSVISERTVYDKDGKEFSFIYQFNPINLNNEIIGVAMTTLEVTELKVVNRILYNNELKYKSLIDNTQTALFHTNTNGTILEANLSACEMFGYSLSEFKNMYRGVIIDETDDNFKILLQQRKVKGISTGRITGIRRGGEKFPIDICSVVYIDEISKESRTSTLIFDVTEQIRNEKYLLETNQIAEVGGWEYDVATNKIYWSSITKKIYGYDQDFMPDIEVGIKHYIEGHSKETITKLFYDAVNYGKEYDAELKIRRVNGEDIWIKTLGKVDRLNGKVVRVYGTFQNIDRAKKTEQLLERSRQEYQSLYTKHPDAVFTLDIEGNIIDLNDNTLKLFNTDLDSIKKYKFIPFYLENEAGIIASNFEEALSKKSVRFEVDVLTKSRTHVMLTYIPVVVDSEVVGVYGIAKDITLQKSAEETLKFHSHLLNAIHQAVIVTDLEGNIIYWNKHAEHLYNYKYEEVINKKIIDVTVSEISKSQAEEIMQQLQNGHSWSGQFLTSDKHGNQFIVMVHNSPLIDKDGKLTGIIGVSWDLSTEIATKNKISFQSNLLDCVEQAIIATDLNGEIYYWNNYAEKLYGVKKDEAIGHKILELFQIDAERSMSNKLELSELFKSGKSWKGELYVKTDKSEFFPVFTTNSPVYDHANVITGIISVSYDVTQQIEMLQELEEINERYEYVTKATSDAIWDWNIKTDEIFQGEGFFSLFGYTSSADKKYFSESAKYIHQDDYIDVINSLQNAINSTKNNWSANYRYLKSNGEFAYILDKAVIIRDENNKAVRLIGAMQDITKSKQEEQQLKLLESVITNSTDSVLITEAEPQNSPGPRILYVNEAFTKMTGYTKEEVIGKSPRFLQGPKSDKNELDRLKRALLNWEPCEIEIINYKKSGEEYWVNFTVVPVADETGWYTHWISIERDVTIRRKEEEEKLKLISELTLSNKELKQFSYITSHNLRAPVANLLGIFNILDLSEITDEFTLQLIDGLKTSTLKLNDTLNDLIKILVIKENTNLPVDKIFFDSTLNNVAESIHSLIHNSKTQIIANFSKAESVSFNKSYLESIFLNMITNSIRYAKPESNPIIKITSKIVKNKTQLIFEDNGLGMNMAKVKNDIFGLYKRFHNHSDSKGIGLYLVHSQITALGGTIDVESEVGVGTKFIITF